MQKRVQLKVEAQLSVLVPKRERSTKLMQKLSIPIPNNGNQEYISRVFANL